MEWFWNFVDAIQPFLVGVLTGVLTFVFSGLAIAALPAAFVAFILGWVAAYIWRKIFAAGNSTVRSVAVIGTSIVITAAGAGIATANVDVNVENPGIVLSVTGTRVSRTDYQPGNKERIEWVFINEEGETQLERVADNEVFFDLQDDEGIFSKGKYTVFIRLIKKVSGESSVISNSVIVEIAQKATEIPTQVEPTPTPETPLSNPLQCEAQRATLTLEELLNCGDHGYKQVVILSEPESYGSDYRKYPGVGKNSYFDGNTLIQYCSGINEPRPSCDMVANKISENTYLKKSYNVRGEFTGDQYFIFTRTGYVYRNESISGKLVVERTIDDCEILDEQVVCD